MLLYNNMQLLMKQLFKFLANLQKLAINYFIQSENQRFELIF